jgi:hypothetical protein
MIMKYDKNTSMPWDETWATDGLSLYVAGEDGERISQFARVDEPLKDGDSWAQDRAELAAAAPEMARQLLELLTGPMAHEPASRTSWTQQRFDAMRAVLRKACVIKGKPVLKART